MAETSLLGLRLEIVSWTLKIMDEYDFGNNTERRALLVNRLGDIEPKNLFFCFLVFMNALGIGINDRERAKGLLESFEKAYDFAERMSVPDEQATRSLKASLDKFLIFVDGLDAEAQKLSSKIKSVVRSLGIKEFNSIVFVTSYVLALNESSPKSANQLYAQGEKIIEDGAFLLHS